jgi:SAM-dependent methyltransferase
VTRWRRIGERTSGFLATATGIKLERLQPNRSQAKHGDRVAYQRQLVAFDLEPGQRVLDVGGGAYPFPPATVIVDRFPGNTEHRHQPLSRDGKPLVVADIERLPFPDHHFDYVYCSHVLEHVVDPIAACEELARVAPRGYIETPTFAKDMLFAWAAGMHKWHVVAIADRLCFFEYSPRQADGIRSTVWRDLLLGTWHHPLQPAFDGNQDVFNVMFPWAAAFHVSLFYLSGETRSARVGR